MSTLFLLAVAFADPISSSYQGYFFQGDKALLEGDFDKAITNYLKGMHYAKPRESVIVKDDLGYAYLQLGKFNRAKDCLESALGSFPENYNIRFYLGVIYLIDKDYVLAAEEFKKIEENVYFDDSWIKIAESSEIFNKFGDKVPESHWMRLRKEQGVALHPKKSKNGALSQKILYIDAFDEKNRGVFLFAQGVVLGELGQNERAQTKFLDAKEAGYGWDELIPSRIHHRLKGHDTSLGYTIHHDFFKTLRSGRLDEAIAKLEKILEVDEDSPEVNHNLALLYFDLAELEEAKVKHLEKAEIFCGRTLWFHQLYKPNHEDRLRYLDLMGNIYFFQGNYERSKEIFLDMLSTDPKDAQTHYNLGCVYYRQRFLDLAESEWQKAIDLDRKKLKWQADEDSSEKEMSYTVTVRKKSVSFIARTSLGRLYLEKNQPGKAVAVLEEAIKLKPNDAEPYLDLARACHCVGLDKKTHSYLERYLFLGGSKKKAEELKALIRKWRHIILDNKTLCEVQ